MSPDAPLPLAFFGAGDRAGVYAEALRAEPRRGRAAAVADPDPARRERFAERYGVPPEGRFGSWEELTAARPAVAAVVNCTLDPLHAASTRAALAAGWHVLLEKPLATDPTEATELVRLAARAERQLVVCHVLRHTRFFRTAREIVRSGRLGRVMAVSHRENVHELHFAHSYVRGNWRRRDASGPLILTKCSHDLDLLGWITGERVARVASFGGRGRFAPEHAPAGAAARCAACALAEACAFDAGDFYGVDRWGWAERALGPLPDEAARRAALRSSRYGRCVWASDNDVVDRQTVLLESAAGTPLELTVHGHADEEGRTLRIDGTRATLYGAFRERAPFLRVRDHAPPDGGARRHGGDGPVESFEVTAGAGRHGADDGGYSGHGGGDAALLTSFLRGLQHGAPDPEATTAAASLESHLLAFAADRARREGRVVAMDAFRREVGADALA